MLLHQQGAKKNRLVRNSGRVGLNKVGKSNQAKKQRLNKQIIKSTT